MVAAAALLTVTETAALVVVFPAASRARADSVWAALVAVAESHDSEKDGPGCSAPSAAPSSRNCTPATPTLSEAVAVTVTTPDTVAPELGAVMLTVGGVVSGGDPPAAVLNATSCMIQNPAPLRGALAV